MQSIFVIRATNVLDLITNSSSELFVLKGQTKEIVEEMVTAVYPDYKREYFDIKATSELDSGDMYSYLSYHYTGWDNWSQKFKVTPIPGFSLEDAFRKSSWGDNYYLNENFVRENLEEIKTNIDPKDEMFFLFSGDENPNWEMQEELMTIGERYHLG